MLCLKKFVDDREGTRSSRQQSGWAFLKALSGTSLTMESLAIFVGKQKQEAAFGFESGILRSGKRRIVYAQT